MSSSYPITRRGRPCRYTPLQFDTGRYAADKRWLPAAPRLGIVTIKALLIINRLLVAALLCDLATSGWAQDLAQEGGRSLDLTVPTGALTRTWGSPAGETAALLPGMGEAPGRPGDGAGPERGGGLRGDLPYGAGYEARRGQGGGWGGGRGRGR